MQEHIVDNREMMKLPDVTKILRQSVHVHVIEKFAAVTTAGLNNSGREADLESEESETPDDDPQEEGTGQSMVTPKTTTTLREERFLQLRKVRQNDSAIGE